jgi:flagellar biosynthesis protein FlhB
MAEKQGGGDESLDDKTEEPTAQKIEDMRKEGQVAQSRELSSLMVFLSAMVVVYMMGPRLGQDFLDFTRRIIFEAGRPELSMERIGSLLSLALGQATYMVLPVAAAGFIAGALGSIMQFGINFSWTPIEPQLERINPLAGFKRIFSLDSLMEGAKALLKLIAVTVVTYLILEKELFRSGSILDMDAPQMMAYMSDSGFRLVMAVCIALFVVAALDFAYQKFRYYKNLMMTKQEVKQEQKNREGDPLLKARVRSIQRERSRKRMMLDVPKADVVVTNPTHIAVAIRYDGEKMAAPRVVAKGADLIAQRIKEIARQNNIPLVENVPLARALHKNIKVGGTIPRSLYQAVAEVLAYVYRLKGKFGSH